MLKKNKKKQSYLVFEINLDTEWDLGLAFFGESCVNSYSMNQIFDDQ